MNISTSNYNFARLSLCFTFLAVYTIRMELYELAYMMDRKCIQSRYIPSCVEHNFLWVHGKESVIVIVDDIKKKDCLNFVNKTENLYDN